MRKGTIRKAGRLILLVMLIVAATVSPSAAQDEGLAEAAVAGPEVVPNEDAPGCRGPGACPGCGRRHGGAGKGMGKMHRGGPNPDVGPRGGGMHGASGRRAGGGCRPEMESIWTLIDNHAAIARRVEEIPGGVRTVTTSEDPELVPVLRRHAQEMEELVRTGGRIRMWDPLFAELMSRSGELRIEVLETEGGVTVLETADDPEVVKLIRAHAAKVMEFVDRGQAAYREETPLPEGYGSARLER